MLRWAAVRLGLEKDATLLAAGAHSFYLCLHPIEQRKECGRRDKREVFKRQKILFVYRLNCLKHRFD